MNTWYVDLVHVLQKFVLMNTYQFTQMSFIRFSSEVTKLAFPTFLSYQIVRRVTYSTEEPCK